MSDKTLVEFQKAYQDCSCTIQRRDYDWVFVFGDRRTITVVAPWRIVQNGRIAHAMQDDRQKFGLPAPVDGEARANGLLEGRRAEHLELDLVTADLRVFFDGETRIDVFNDSSGYEGWQATFPVDGDGVVIIGLGGGDVAIFRHPDPVQNS
jgi:hypothetical protein